MTNLEVKNNSELKVNFDETKIDLIRNTVAKGASDDELQMFLHLAGQYNLDPFKKEIWFVKYGGQTTIMTSRDGYLKYAQMNPEFEGLMSFVVKEGDVFEIDASEYKITHKFGTKRGNILGAWARCDRTGKKPFITYVEFSEYNKNNNVWRTYPSAMIQKVAESFVLKRAFGINGLVTNEELGVKEDGPKATISKQEAEALFDVAKGHNEIVRDVLDKYGFKRSMDITNLIYVEIYEEVSKRVEIVEQEIIDEVENTDYEGTPFIDEEDEE